jgi:hypothetical protein
MSDASIDHLPRHDDQDREGRGPGRARGRDPPSRHDKRYWPAVSPTLAPSWAERSRGILDQVILPAFGDRRLSGIRQEAIERWSAGRRASVKGSTANKELARLKHLLARAVAWGYLKVSPAAKVTKAKEQDGRVRYLTAEERRRAHQRCREQRQSEGWPVMAHSQ